VVLTKIEIRSLISQVVERPIYHSTEKQDIVGLNCLVDVGNTHGWHLDEGAFILIAIFEAPPEGKGGIVEFIPNWELYAEQFKYDKNQPIEECVQKCRENNLVNTHYHTPGDAYLLRGDLALHRVTSLTSSGYERTIIGMEYADIPNAVSKNRVSGLYDDR
jgi:hypothetical protein